MAKATAANTASRRGVLALASGLTGASVAACLRPASGRSSTTVTDCVRGVCEGQAVKSPVRVATTENITLSGLQTIDGVALTPADRVLVKDQTNAKLNGIYIASAGDWQRALDFQGDMDVVKGTRVHITDGGANSGASFSVTASSIAFNTTEIRFTRDVVPAAIVSGFGTRALAAAATIPTGQDYIQTAGYSLAGDGGGAPYRRVDTEPSHQGKFQSADGGWWELASNDGYIKPEQFGAMLDGATDDTDALNAAGQYCTLKGAILKGDAGKEAFVNGEWVFDCSVEGGRYSVGPTGSIAMRPSTNMQYRFEGRIDNLSGNENRQGLLCRGVDEDISTGRTGYLSVKLESYGFKNSVYGQNLKLFHVEDGSHFESTNTIPGSFAEAHVACHSTEVYLVGEIVSIGGVLGILSGVYVGVEIFNGGYIRDTYDHGVYSSTTPQKVLTVFNDMTVLNTGGVGLKCYSNGELIINNPAIRNTGNIGIIATANKAYVKGGTIDGTQGVGVYQTGKESGAGVNMFEEFVVQGVTMRNIGSTAVQVQGPETLDKVRVIDCDIEANARVLFVVSPTEVKEVEVRGGRLRGGLSGNADIIISLTAEIEKVTIKLPIIMRDASSANSNLIDIENAGELNVIDPTFDFARCQSLIRSRKATGVLNVQGIKKLSGFCTELNQVRSDGSIFIYDWFVGSTGQLLRRGSVATLPMTGTWELGEDLTNGVPTSGDPPGWVCTTAGTLGTLTDVTGSTISGTNSVTVNDASQFVVGQYILITGVTGVKRIINIQRNVMTLNSNSSASVTEGKISFRPAEFKAKANLA